ncbi:hypothetical protein GJ697_11665 [Pseudoduganella sp. FT25W]|uniref:Uncharacterized protein n=1 Tax=Duganella alba TaxID=2666081 RepID=A0A6L5QFJ9_9BURK|nr:hypothetical protein [Duganella alba]MRX08495.1 hypothetical protein [Duganella alba]MRX17031.1 hypothetical protein [Duganella alba]
MSIYHREGQRAFTEFAAALAEEQAAAHELAQCAKIDAYHLVAQDVFKRLTAAHAKTTAAFEQIECFRVNGAS